MGLLGIGYWTAQVVNRGGGGSIVWLDPIALTMGRVVDNCSDASANFAFADPTDPRGGLPDKQRHELNLYRTTDPLRISGWGLEWAGPLLGQEYPYGGLNLKARDLTWWWDHRRLRTAMVHDQIDLATIFTDYSADAMAPDPSPNLTVVATPTGILGDREIVVEQFPYAGDALRELARTGIDYTAIGRQIRVGATVVPATPLATLTDEHFVSGTPSIDGGSMATDIIVTGAGGGANGFDVYGEASGGIGLYGLIDSVESEPNIEDNASCTVAAQTRLDRANTDPVLFSGQLDPSAPVAFGDLVPGAVVRLRLAQRVRSIDTLMRLASVSVSVSPQGESVSIQLQPVGTT